MNKMRFLLLPIFFAFISCSLYKTPDLPDINKKSFSYEEVVKKKSVLAEKRMTIKEQ